MTRRRSAARTAASNTVVTDDAANDTDNWNDDTSEGNGDGEGDGDDYTDQYSEHSEIWHSENSDLAFGGSGNDTAERAQIKTDYHNKHAYDNAMGMGWGRSGAYSTYSEESYPDNGSHDQIQPHQEGDSRMVSGKEGDSRMVSGEHSRHSSKPLQNPDGVRGTSPTPCTTTPPEQASTTSNLVALCHLRPLVLHSSQLQNPAALCHCRPLVLHSSRLQNPVAFRHLRPLVFHSLQLQNLVALWLA
jgi:hypothetical protein